MQSSGSGPPCCRELKQLCSGAPLSDDFFYHYLEHLDGARRTEAAGGPDKVPASRGVGDGAMTLPRREQVITVSSSRLSPGQFLLQPGGKVVIAVAPDGPQQAFSIGRDVEESFVTPVIPAGSRYEWTPPEPGRYFVQSEVYPHLRSAIRVLAEEQQEETTAVPLPGAGRRRSSWSSARSSLAGEPSSDGSTMAAAAVDEPISFPALLSARTGPMATSVSRATQTGSGLGSSTVSRHTSTAGLSRAPPAAAPGTVLGRFATSPAGFAEGAEAEEGSLLDSPPESGLRRRARPTSGGAAASAGVAKPVAQQQPGRSSSTLPPLGSRHLAMPLSAADGFSVLSSGSGGSPRSGSGSERSSSSAPLYVQRRVPGGMLQTTHAFSSAAARGGYSRSDSRSGGSEETTPLLYSLGPRGGSGQVPAASYSSGSSYRQYSPAGSQHVRRAPEEDREAKDKHTCPRCRKVYVSTINFRRCISSHLCAGNARAARGGIPDAPQLASFWDGLDEAEKRHVMDVRNEHNGELLMRQLEIQKLHRQRSGVMDQLTQEQKRLHASGMLLHSACPGGRGSDGGALQSLTGAHLMRVLGEVSEGTFLFDRNPISQDEFAVANNYEAGLGALVMKRLVDAHLAAKQRQADRMQRELEDQEAAQEALKSGKQQQAGSGAPQQQQAGKKKPKAKAKGKAAAATAAKAAKAAPAPAPAAPPPPSDSASDSEAAPPVPQQQPQQPQPAAKPVLANGAAAAVVASDALSPPRPSGEERYGSSPQKPAPPASGRASFTNFLFAEEADTEEEAAVSLSVDANGWRTAGSGRSSRSSNHGAGPRAVPSGRQQAAAGAKGTVTGAGAPHVGDARNSSASRVAERTASRPAGDRPSAAAATAAAAKAGVPTMNGKVPAGARQQATAGSKQLQQAPPAGDSFPALAPAAGAKSTPAAPAPTKGGAAGGSVSYALAAKTRKEGSKPAPAPKPQPAAVAQQAQQQEEAHAPSSLAQQPKSWPVPGQGVHGAAAQAQSGSSTAAEPSAPAGAAVQAAAEAATMAEPLAQAPPQLAAAVPAEQPTADALAPATGGSDAAQAEQIAAAAEAHRCTSVTPPISDAGSPPPGMMMPHPGSFPMSAWVVGPDGAPMPPPPMGFYWGMVPVPPPGMQYPGMDPSEGGMAPGPYPYPFYAPMPYPTLPPGHPAAGMPMPPLHMLPFGGADGQLAPFPPGMAVPLPPEAADELAAVAAAANGQPAGSFGEGPTPSLTDEEAQAMGPAAAGEGEELPADAVAAPALTAAQDRAPAEHQQQSGGVPGAAQVPAEQRQGSAGKNNFLAMLQEACGVPATGEVQPRATSHGGQKRGAGTRSAGFDAAAAAAELERRWHVASAQSVPTSSLPAVSRPAAPTGALAAARVDRRSSSGGGGAAKPAKVHAKLGSSSGRSSPAGGTKPVVVAVRAFTSDDSASSDGAAPKWRISTAPPPGKPALESQHQPQHLPGKHAAAAANAH